MGAAQYAQAEGIVIRWENIKFGQANSFTKNWRPTCVFTIRCRLGWGDQPKGSSRIPVKPTIVERNSFSNLRASLGNSALGLRFGNLHRRLLAQLDWAQGSFCADRHFANEKLFKEAMIEFGFCRNCGLRIAFRAGHDGFQICDLPLKSHGI